VHAQTIGRPDPEQTYRNQLTSVLNPGKQDQIKPDEPTSDQGRAGHQGRRRNARRARPLAVVQIETINSIFSAGTCK
jgi:hypothetical protein